MCQVPVFSVKKWSLDEKEMSVRGRKKRKKRGVKEAQHRELPNVVTSPDSV